MDTKTTIVTADFFHLCWFIGDSIVHKYFGKLMRYNPSNIKGWPKMDIMLHLRLL